MIDFHARAIVADQLQTIYRTPATTLEFAALLDKIDRKTGKPARRCVTVLVRS